MKPNNSKYIKKHYGTQAYYLQKDKVSVKNLPASFQEKCNFIYIAPETFLRTRYIITQSINYKLTKNKNKQIKFLDLTHLYFD